MTKQLDNQPEVELEGSDFNADELAVVLTDENISQEQINEMKMLGLERPPGVSSERWHRLQNHRIEYDHIIRLAAAGTPQWKIAEAVGYDQAHVSKVLNTPAVREKIEQEVRDIYGTDWKASLKDRNAKAVGVVDEVLETGNTKEKSNMARWVLEQTVGKASQEIIEKKTSLTELIIKIEQMEQNKLREVGSSSALLPSSPDPFDTIIEQTIPKGMVVGKRSLGEGQG